ncbi:MAG: integrase arm-type DNA-binding domain-containing protein [Paracoccus sp. (in: a-proteobacteria)]|uniref:integrase arm-type DNA-binding domain-containing protein n=1 Tax=Paracoccus sp. TaxID=267 RepID=UPI0040594336
MGSFPDVGLGEARERAREAKNHVWPGVDPIEKRKAARAALAASWAGRPMLRTPPINMPPRSWRTRVQCGTKPLALLHRAVCIAAHLQNTSRKFAGAGYAAGAASDLAGQDGNSYPRQRAD